VPVVAFTLPAALKAELHSWAHAVHDDADDHVTVMLCAAPVADAQYQNSIAHAPIVLLRPMNTKVPMLEVKAVTVSPALPPSSQTATRTPLPIVVLEENTLYAVPEEVCALAVLS
jgi:hypothetical protein